MKRIIFCSMVFLMLATIFSGCIGDSGGGANPTPTPSTGNTPTPTPTSGLTIMLSDDFESYTGYPVWTSTGNWENISTGQEGGDGIVAIMVDDGPEGQGRVVKHTGGGWVAMVNNSFIGTNYTYTIKIKPGTTTIDMGILGRYVDLNNYFYLTIDEGNKLKLYKCHSGTIEKVTENTIDYNTSTYYQLELVFNGNQITGYFEDKSVTYTDDGVTYGPLISSGKIGFVGSPDSLALFDDVQVTP